MKRASLSEHNLLDNDVKNDSLRERVYQYLNNAMRGGLLRYGEYLDQDAICKELDVSKAPLRDALIRLESEGFVTILPRRGVFINPLSEDFIRSAYQIIGAVEADCIHEVFDLLTPEHVRRFEESNALQYQMLESDDYVHYYDENIAFHNIFLSLSKNTLLHQVIDPLRRRLYDFPRRHYPQEWEKYNLTEHQRFIDSVKVGNRTAAASIFRNEHWSFEIHSKYFDLYYTFS